MALESLFTKEQIVEQYCNSIYAGVARGHFALVGIGSASYDTFAKKPQTGVPADARGQSAVCAEAEVRRDH